MKSVGTVYLVGAGPGDPQLLTLRGAELLTRAQVVVCDALVSPELLRFVPADAEIIRRSREHALPQEELNQLLVKRASEGKCVVHLKGGDPYVFGRGGEEAEGLVAAGIPFEVVPGVSSVSAVPNYAGIPLTHRAVSSSFTVITGHEDPAKEERNVDWAQVAKTPGTKLILMGAERIDQLASTLQTHGMASDTPVAMIRWGTTGQQRTVVGTLADIAVRAAEAKLTAPIVTVVGSVVALRDRLNWFEKKSLFGLRVVVTRGREQAQELAAPLLERGAEVIEVPTIRIAPPKDRQALVEAIAGLGAYDWVIFTSANGVNSFFGYFFLAFEDLRDLGGMRIAAVGPATAARLKELHLKVELMPKEYTAKHIAKALADYETVENLRILLLRAEVATPELPKLLEDLGGIVDDVACYRTEPETEDRTGAVARLKETGADWITFTSGSTVENFHARFDLPELGRQFPEMKFASIGPETSKALVALGLKPTFEAQPHTLDGLVEGLEKASLGRGRGANPKLRGKKP